MKTKLNKNALLAFMALAMFVTMVLQPVAAAKKPRAETTLNQEQVRQFLQQMDAQAMQKNLNGLMDCFAAAVQVVVLTPTPMGPQPMNFGFEDYRKLMDATLNSAKEYKVTRQDVNVQIAADDKAVVTDINFETLVTKDKTIKTIANEQMEIILIDGKLKLNRLNSQVLSTTE